MAYSNCSGNRVDRCRISIRGKEMVMAAYNMPNRHSRMLNAVLLVCAVFLVVLLGGCSQQALYADQSEQQANEMVAVLSEGHIEAGKEAGEEGLWTVTVSQGDFAKAVDLLRARGLPREKFESTGTLFKPSGMSDTPLAQRARLIYAQEQELNNMISQFDGVVSAQVKLAMPAPDPLSQESKPTSASVLVKHRTGFDLRSKTAAIKSLVANGVEGLAYDNVSVVVEPAQQLPLVKAQDDSIRFATLAKIAAGIGALLLLLFALRAISRKRRRQPTPVTLTESVID
jgi:type III secretion protein J